MTPDEDTAAEIREAITHLAATAAKLPAHWVDRKKALHDQINEHLESLELIEGWLEEQTV
jgi:hypothetical protein